MADKTQAELDAENKANGGETIVKETTGKTPEEIEQLVVKNATIAEDQRKRAEKAEAALKVKTDAEAAEKAKKDAEANKATENQNNNSSQSDPLEVAKIANTLNGLSDEAITQLSLVAKAKGISLAEAKKDPLFSAWFIQAEEVAKKERAKLGGSRGSSVGDDEKMPEGLVPDIHKPLSDQRTAHMNAVKELMKK